MIVAIVILLLLSMLAAIALGLLCVLAFVAALTFDLTVLPIAGAWMRKYESRFA